jgi:hypothetical protein
MAFNSAGPAPEGLDGASNPIYFTGDNAQYADADQVTALRIFLFVLARHQIHFLHASLIETLISVSVICDGRSVVTSTLTSAPSLSSEASSVWPL